MVLLTSPPGKEAKKGRGGKIEVSSAHDTPPSSMLSLCSRYLQKIYNLFLSASTENSEYKKTQPPVLICNGTGYLFLKCSVFFAFELIYLILHQPCRANIFRYFLCTLNNDSAANIDTLHFNNLVSSSCDYSSHVCS